MPARGVVLGVSLDGKAPGTSLLSLIPPIDALRTKIAALTLCVGEASWSGLHRAENRRAKCDAFGRRVRRRPSYRPLPRTSRRFMVLARS